MPIRVRAARSRAAIALPLLAACLLLVVACDPAPPTRGVASTGPSPQPATPAPLLDERVPPVDPAIHTFLWGNAPTTERDLRLAREGGFTWVKQRFEWRNIEQDAKGQFAWTEPDRIVDSVRANGLRLIARVDNQPRWASSSITFPGSGPPDNLQDWTDYLTALASRYRGRIDAYEIWNEPNLAREWGGRPPDPLAYTRLLKASYAAIKAADPGALVVTAGMSPTTTSSNEAMRDLDFYRGMYAAGAKGAYDILGVHATGFRADPCADPGVVAADPGLTNGDPSPTDVKRVYAFRHVEDVRVIMEQAGDGAKQVGVLETGWTTDLRPESDYRWFAVSEEQQGVRLAAAFRCARERWSDWLAFMTVIYLPDPAWTPKMEQYWWSIVSPNGAPRPAYNALKELLRP